MFWEKMTHRKQTDAAARIATRPLESRLPRGEARRRPPPGTRLVEQRPPSPLQHAAGAVLASQPTSLPPPAAGVEPATATQHAPPLSPLFSARRARPSCACPADSRALRRPHRTRLLELRPPSLPQHAAGGVARARRAPARSRFDQEETLAALRREREQASEEEDGAERSGVEGIGSEKRRKKAPRPGTELWPPDRLRARRRGGAGRRAP